MKRLEPGHPPLTTFSMASLTDIVMLLVIFFLLSSSYIVQPGIKVELPDSETAQVVDEKNIVIAVTREGVVWVQNERTTVQRLAATLRPMIVHGASQTVVIKADKQVSLETAVHVIDQVKAAGGERFLIATVKE